MFTVLWKIISDLCWNIRESSEKDDLEKVKALLDEQKKFNKKHIINWVYSFTSDVAKFADRDFYKGVAKITNGFIKKETEFLKGGAASWDIQ